MAENLVGQMTYEVAPVWYPAGEYDQSFLSPFMRFIAPYHFRRWWDDD
jgi:hypothetical protein